MNKKLVFFLLLPFLFSLSFFTVSAEIIPEDDIIGETLVIEPDENFVKDNIDDEGIYDDFEFGYEFETDKVISFDKKTYITKLVFPFVILVALGAATYFVIEGSKKLRR